MTDQNKPTPAYKVEPFASIDETLGQIKADHAAAMRELTDRLTAAQIEVSLAKDQLKTAVEKRIEAEQRTAALQSLFAVVRHVLDEAEAMDHKTDNGGKTPLPASAGLFGLAATFEEIEKHSPDA